LQEDELLEQIRRIDYRQQNKGIQDFEILTLEHFFARRPKALLERDHRLNFWVILYITAGHGRHFVDFEGYDYQAGDILFVQKNQVHRFAVNDSARGYVMHINEPFLIHLNQARRNVFLEFVDQAFGSPVIKADASPDSTNRRLVDLLFSEYEREVKREDQVFIRTLFESFVLSVRKDFSTKTNRLKGSEYRIFAEFRDLVELHYAQHFTLDRYANMMGVSKKTINQATRAIVDMSAKEFVNQRLFLEIKRYLSQGELMIYEIAELLGFDEPANMTKFFKNREGLSPRGFRALI